MPMPVLPSDMPHGSMPNGGASEMVVIPEDAQRIDVVGTEFAFAPDEVAAEADRPIVITFENDGTADHDWTVHAADGTELAHAHAEPGESTEVVVSLDAGSYSVRCTVAGHKEAGMVGRLRVS